MAAAEWVTVDEWAGRHKITRQAAYKRIRDHQIPLRNGKLNPEEADRIWFASYNPAKQNGGVAGGQAAAEARSEAQPTLFDVEDKIAGVEQLPDSPDGVRGRMPQTALGRVQLARDLARANWERMRLDREQGKLVPIAEVTRFYNELFTRVRDELSSVGAETMNGLADTSDAVECCEIVDRRIEKALRSISEWRPGTK